MRFRTPVVWKRRISQTTTEMRRPLLKKIPRKFSYKKWKRLKSGKDEMMDEESPSNQTAE